MENNLILQFYCRQINNNCCGRRKGAYNSFEENPYNPFLNYKICVIISVLYKNFDYQKLVYMYM